LRLRVWDVSWVAIRTLLGFVFATNGNGFSC
jgi:hypothetical protein